MWTDLAIAFESKIAVLEEARREYVRSVDEVVDEVAPALEMAVRSVLAANGDDHLAEPAKVERSDDATFAGAPWIHVTVADEQAAEFRITAWVAASFGGPAGTLRVALSLERVRVGLDHRLWVANCSGAIPDSTPCELFDPLHFPDIASSRPILRVVSIGLLDKSAREVASEARDAARGLIEHVPAMLDMIRDAGLAMLRAEQALLEFRPKLDAMAAHVGAPVVPKVSGLGEWQGGKFLQVGHFWVRAHRAFNQLLVECNSEDEAVVVGLAS